MTYDKRYARKRRAWHNIPIVKIFRISANDSLMSLYYTKTYEIGTKYELTKPLKLEFDESNPVISRWTIQEGFHSILKKKVNFKMTWRTKDRLLSGYVIDIQLSLKCWVGHEHITRYPYDLVMMKGYIPRGSTYYQAENCFIVSDKLVITKPINLPLHD